MIGSPLYNLASYVLQTKVGAFVGHYATQTANQFYYYTFTKPQTKTLIDAIRQGNIQAFREASKSAQGYRYYQAHGFPRSLLHEAIEHHNLEFVAELITRSDPNELSEGLTPLSRAIKLGHIDIARFLILHGASIHFGSLQTLPSVLRVAVANNILTAREAETLAYELMWDHRHLDLSQPYMAPIKKLLTLENARYQAHQEQCQALENALSDFSQENTIAKELNHLPTKYETTVKDINAPLLCINFPSKHNVAALKEELSKIERYSIKGYELKSRIKHAKETTKVEHSLIEAFAKRCQAAFAKNNMNVAIQLNPQYDQQQKVVVRLDLPCLDKAFPSTKDMQNIESQYQTDSGSFIEAVKSHDLTTALQCLKNEIKAHSEPALHSACKQDSLDMTRLILGAGAHVNQVFNEQTPLQIALAKGNEALAVLLIENGANPNESIDGKSALYIASANKWPRLTRALLEKNADPAITFNNETPLDVAFRLGDLEVLKIYQQREHTFINHHLQKYSKYCSGSPRNSAFDWHVALSENNAELINILKALRINCNSLDATYGRPLHHAISIGKMDMVSDLLTMGADPRLTFQNLNALEYAVHLKNTAMVEKMILKGMVKTLRLNPVWFFRYCFENKLYDGAHYLLESGMPKVWWKEGDTFIYPPLLQAIMLQEPLLMRELLKQSNVHQETATWCIQTGNEMMLPPLNEAVRINHLEMVKILHENIGSNLSKVIDKPLLHQAIIAGLTNPRLLIIKYLLENHFDVNELYRDLTPLQAAIESLQPRTVECLVEHAANLDINRQNSRGETALHTAMKMPFIDMEVIFTLISRGANLLIKNKHGQCPFDIVMLNPALRNQMIAHYGEAFINDRLQVQNCLANILSQEEVRNHLVNDPLIGQAGLNWLTSQTNQGTQVSEACLAQLCMHDEFMVAFVNEHLGSDYLQHLQNNLPTLIKVYEAIPSQNPPIVTAFKQHQNATTSTLDSVSAKENGLDSPRQTRLGG